MGDGQVQTERGTINERGRGKGLDAGQQPAFGWVVAISPSPSDETLDDSFSNTMGVRWFSVTDDGVERAVQQD